ARVRRLLSGAVELLGNLRVVWLGVTNTIFGPAPKQHGRADDQRQAEQGAENSSRAKLGDAGSRLWVDERIRLWQSDRSRHRCGKFATLKRLNCPMNARRRFQIDVQLAIVAKRFLSRDISPQRRVQLL